MSMTKEATERRICAIVDQYRGLPYSKVLKDYNLTPREFSTTVYRSLDRIIEEPIVQRDRVMKQIFEHVITDDNIKMNLFEIEEKFLIKQYNKLWKNELDLRKQYDEEGKPRPKKREDVFVDGTHACPENKRILVPYILEFHHPKLKNPGREQVVETMDELLVKPKEYFHGLKLKGLMLRALDRGSTDSVKELLKIYDYTYQIDRQQPSLFNPFELHHCSWKTRDDVTAKNRSSKKT